MMRIKIARSSTANAMGWLQQKCGDAAVCNDGWMDGQCHMLNNNMQQVMIQSFQTQNLLSFTNDAPRDSPLKHRISDLLEPHPSRVTPQQAGTLSPTIAIPNKTPETEGKKVQQDDREEWPELESILRKIRRLEERLREERQLRREAEESANTQIKRAAEEQGKRATLQTQLQTGQEMRNELQIRLDQLQEALLLEKQQMLQELQFTQIKRKNEHEQKIRKAGLESKELTDRLRKANLELEQERVNCRVLKESMQKQIAQIQSQREEYLAGELDRIKGLLVLSEEERQTRLLEQVNTMSRKVYKLEEELKRKAIELSLLERKKHQAINDAVQRKDGEIKVQKSLFKSLTDKFAKLQEQLKIARTSDGKGRQNRLDREEEVSFELSPEKM